MLRLGLGLSATPTLTKPALGEERNREACVAEARCCFVAVCVPWACAGYVVSPS